MSSNFPHKERLELIMEKGQFSVSDLANKLEISRQGLHRNLKEPGKPSFDLLRALHERLNVDLNWFVSGDGVPYGEEIPLKQTKKRLETADLKRELAEKDLQMCKMEVSYLKRLLSSHGIEEK